MENKSLRCRPLRFSRCLLTQPIWPVLTNTIPSYPESFHKSKKCIALTNTSKIFRLNYHIFSLAVLKRSILEKVVLCCFVCEVIICWRNKGNEVWRPIIWGPKHHLKGTHPSRVFLSTCQSENICSFFVLLYITYYITYIFGNGSPPITNAWRS